MNPLLARGLLLAADTADPRLERIRGLRQGFTQPSSDSNMFPMFVTVVAICLAVVLADQVYRAYKRRRPTRHVDYLVQVGRVLGLNWRELRLVRSLGQQAGLPQPAVVLLSPANLAYAAQVALNGNHNARLRARLQKLCRTVFGTDLPLDA